MRDYQYETSPRKISPQYVDKPKRKQASKSRKSSVKNNSNDKYKNSNNKSRNKKSENVRSKREKARNDFKVKFLLLINFICLFGILFTVLYRTSLINQSFSQIQTLKAQVTDIQKENDQIEIGIQNSLNANNLEQLAKEMLGMQKLTSKQTVYLTLPKKDYVEPSTEQVILEDNNGFFSKVLDLLEKFKNLF